MHASRVVRIVGLLPGLAIVGGALCAAPLGGAGAPARLAASGDGRGRCGRVASTRDATHGRLVVLGFWACSVVLADRAAEQRASSLAYANCSIERSVDSRSRTLGPERDHDPILTRAVLTEDASPRDGYVSLRAEVRALSIRGVWQPVEGAVTVSVGGAAHARPGTRVAGGPYDSGADRVPASGAIPERRCAGLRARARARRHSAVRFGQERAARGPRLATGGPIDERAADIRAHVRRALATWVAPHDAVSAAISAAVLIGDRTGLPDDTRSALQAAGTYHVIAISGGNIAIVAAAVCGLLALCGIRGRLPARC